MLGELPKMSTIWPGGAGRQGASGIERVGQSEGRNPLEAAEGEDGAPCRPDSKLTSVSY